MHSPLRGPTLALALSCAALGATLAFLWFRPVPPAGPSPTLVVERVREVARLEALEVLLYRKVSFRPEPSLSGSLWGDVWSWARQTLRDPHGRVIVFARAHLLYDLRKLEPDQLRMEGTRANLTLPPLEVVVELLPGETEVLDSTLNTQETAQLLELARTALEREVRGDAKLRTRAQASAQDTLRSLLFELGFRQVVVTAPPSL